MEPGHFCVKVGWSAHRFRGIPWFLLVEMESADRLSSVLSNMRSFDGQNNVLLSTRYLLL